MGLGDGKGLGFWAVGLGVEFRCCRLLFMMVACEKEYGSLEL